MHAVRRFCLSLAAVATVVACCAWNAAPDGARVQVATDDVAVAHRSADASHCTVDLVPLAPQTPLNGLQSSEPTPLALTRLQRTGGSGRAPGDSDAPLVGFVSARRMVAVAKTVSATLAARPSVLGSLVAQHVRLQV